MANEKTPKSWSEPLWLDNCSVRFRSLAGHGTQHRRDGHSHSDHDAVDCALRARDDQHATRLARRRGQARVGGRIVTHKPGADHHFQPVTTVSGFLSVNCSESPPLALLGNLTDFGTLLTFVLSVTFLPALPAVSPNRFRVWRRARDPSRFSVPVDDPATAQ